jgi:hypothetical protein
LVKAGGFLAFAEPVVEQKEALRVLFKSFEFRGQRIAWTGVRAPEPGAARRTSQVVSSILMRMKTRLYMHVKRFGRFQDCILADDDLRFLIEFKEQHFPPYFSQQEGQTKIEDVAMAGAGVVEILKIGSCRDSASK